MTLRKEVDALVVGAGFGGIYSTYCLSRMGLDVQCIDIASGVGGTWYWNRYPGAMSDTESYLYRFSWDKEDLRTYPWSNHYVYQPEILKYLEHVVEKHGLEKYMHFNCEMKDATWDDSMKRWRVTCSTGDTVLARYLLTSLGLLCKANYPNFPGQSSFRGDILHTAQWDDAVELRGKRVGIIGNGSSGVQVMTAIAPIVGSLVSFQRHPQYSVPSGQGPVSQEYRDKINADYDNIWNAAFASNIAFGYHESTRKTMEATPEERQQAFQDVWDQGNGFRFTFSAFGDITNNEDANKEVCNFIRNKIDEIVKDPKKAAVLKPKDLYARRPLCDSGYYEVFNRDNVDVVDLQQTSIQEITTEGIKLTDGSVAKLDVLIFATGFEAIEGSYNRVNIIGRNGETMKDHWKDGLRAYGSIAMAGFPNMFIISGPQGPFANFPPTLESETNFVMSCIRYAEGTSAESTETRIEDANRASNDTNNESLGHAKNYPRVIEVTKEAEDEWDNTCTNSSKESLFTTNASWISNQNVSGRKLSTNFYFGGLRSYIEWVNTQLAQGLPGFKLE